jgi:dTDP-4-dehydrorhamnose reductase
MLSSKKSVLISGASGLLGSRFCAHYKNQGNFVGAIYRSKTPSDFDIKYEIDLSNRDQLARISESYDLIINCAGFTNVEENEKYPERSWSDNVVAASNLSDYSRRRNIKFVHISTDHFESQIKSPRSELVDISPVNQYGYAKLEAEKTILNFNQEALIIRSNFFGRSKLSSSSLLDWILNQIAEKKTIKGYSDVYFSPLSIEVLMQSIDELINKNLFGIYNLGSLDVVSKLDFIKLIFQHLGLDQSLVIESSIDINPALIKRPKFMALDSGKYEQDSKLSMPKVEDMLKSELMLN